MNFRYDFNIQDSIHITHYAKIAKYIDICKYFSVIFVNDLNNIKIVVKVIVMK